jgi:hypothetical protein
MSTTATAADALSRPIAVPAAEPVAVSATDRYAPLREGDTPVSPRSWDRRDPASRP